VEAACTRAIIIDRGAIVANGTPGELKARSERAGAVLITVRGPSAAQVAATLGRLPQVSRSEILADDASQVVVRAYPDRSRANGAFAALVAEAALQERWTIAELHTEEGRLDDVFRSLTRPDTAREAA
jgi:ABC-2 type transport system ATP-binding protein